MQPPIQAEVPVEATPDAVKPPHDASIFVGRQVQPLYALLVAILTRTHSLPSNIDQADLTRSLMEHLSGHSGIKNIKVVRDSKGGICAFVQCEDAATASTLLEMLQSSPQKPFMGRILRYEPARAFRTLLISYRIPVQVIGTPCASGPHAYTQVQLNLPTSMKIWKHRNAKFYSISYDLHPSETDVTGAPDDPDHDSVVLNPLTFTADTLLSITSYFGPLESFAPLEIPEQPDGSQVDAERPDTQAYVRYPQPHNAPKAESMEATCWQVKWQHRNDCVSALMTLRRIPHLTVTWAHQPTSSGYNPRQQNYLYQTPQQWRRSRSPSHLPRQLARGQSPSSLSRMAQGPEEHSPRHSKLPLLDAFSTTQRHNRGSALPPNEATSEIVAPDHDVETISLDATNPTLGFSADPIAHSSPHLTPMMGTRPLGDAQSDHTQHDFVHRMNVDNARPQQHERVIDPNTLFVGGLEMFGPRAWNEDRVRKLFSRFEGLEHVKFVRPTNSCAAFAFVKFDNPEAPAKAVAEEHNKVYDGRTIRVQLRDCNPPRGIWKYGKGRGRAYHHFFQPSKRTPLKAQEPTQHGDEESQLDAESRMNGHGTPKPMDESTSTTLVEDTPHSQPSLLLPSSLSYSPSDSGNYREWYDPLESSSPTPAPSSLGSSVSTTGLAIPPMYPPMPTHPYFPAAAWVHPYITPAPFPMPYYSGYPMFPPVHPAQTLPSPPGSDVSGPTTAAVMPSWPHMGVYGPFVPYPMVPSPTGPVAMEQPQPPLHGPLGGPPLPQNYAQHDQDESGSTQTYYAGPAGFPQMGMSVPPPYTRSATFHHAHMLAGRVQPSGVGHHPPMPFQQEPNVQFHGTLHQRQPRREGWGYMNNGRNFRTQRPPKQQPQGSVHNAGNGQAVLQPAQVLANWNHS